MANGGENTTQATHITELDFDISKIPAQFAELEKNVESGSKRLKDKINANMTLDLNINTSTLKVEKDIDIFGKRIEMSIKKAKEILRNEGDTGMALIDYFKSSGKNKKIINWSDELEADFGKGASNLKKSMSSYVKWVSDGTGTSIDVIGQEIAKSVSGMQKISNQFNLSDIAEEINNEINKYRSNITKLTTGAFENNEIDEMFKKRYSLTNDDESIELIETMYNKKVAAIKKGNEEITKAYNVSDRTGLGYSDLEKRVNEIKLSGAKESKIEIVSNADNEILKATILYTDKLGSSWKETMGWIEKTDEETKEIVKTFQTINYVDIDEPMKRANIAMKELEKSFRNYSNLKKQVETKDMGIQEQLIMQERLNIAQKEYQKNLNTVVILKTEQNSSQSKIVSILNREKELQEDITIEIEKQNIAKQKKIDDSFSKESKDLTSSLLSMEKVAKEIGLSPKFTEETTSIRKEIENIVKLNPVITKEEQIQLKFLSMKSEELKEQVKYAKIQYDENLKNEKVYKSELKNLDSLIEKQKDFSQKQIASKSSNTDIKNQSNEYIVQLETLKQQLIVNKKLEESEKNKLDSIVQNTNELSRQSMIQPENEEDSLFQNVFNEIGNDMKSKIVEIAEEILPKTLNILKETEFGIMEVTRVLGEADLNIEKFTTNVLKLANNYGRTFDDAQEVILRFAQAGYESAESLKLAETTMIALNTAELSTEQSTNSLIGIMKQWGIEINEFPLLIDKINYAADNYAVTSQDLVDGLLRSSSSAKNAKISFDEAIGSIVAMREASGRTGAEVGNAFNSLINYTQRAKSLNVFESLGVKVYADDARTSLVPLLDMWGALADKVKTGGDEIITTLERQTDLSNLMTEEVANATDSLEEYNKALEEESEWVKQGLNDSEKQSVYLQAGTHRRNYFIALLSNFNKVQEVAIDLQNAEGHSIKENSKYMETLTAKYNQFISAMQGLAVESGNAGLLGLAKDILDIGTALATTSKSLRSMPMLFAAVTLAFALFNKQTKIFGLDVTTWNNFRTSFSTAMQSANNNLVQYSLQMAIATGKTILFKLSIAALQAMATFGISIAISGIIDLLSKWANKVSTVDEEITILTNKMNEITDTYNNHANSLVKIKDEYAKLSQGISASGQNLKLTSEEFEKYNAFQIELAEIFPELINGYDKQGNAIIALKGNVSEVTSQLDLMLEKQKEISNFKILENSQNMFKIVNKSINEYEKNIEKAKQTIEKFDNVAKLKDSPVDMFNAEDMSKSLRELGVDFKAIEKNGMYSYTFDASEFENQRKLANIAVKKLNEDMDSEFKKLNPIIKAKIELDVNYSKLSEDTQKFALLIADKMKFTNEYDAFEWVQSYLYELEQATPDIISAIENITNTENMFKKGELDAENYNTKMVEIFERLKQIIPSDIFEDFSEGFKAPIIPLDELSEKLTMVEELTNRLKETYQTLDVHIKDTNTSIDNLQSSYSILTTAVAEYNSAEGMSIDTIQSLLSLDFQYLALLINENGQFEINKTSLQNLTMAKIEELEVTALRQAQNMISTLESEAMAQEFLKNSYKNTANEASKLNLEILAMIGSMNFSTDTTNQLESYINNLSSAFAKLRSNVGKGNYTAVAPQKTSTPSSSTNSAKSSGISKSWYDSQVEMFERLNRMGQKNEQNVVDFYRSMTKSSKLSSEERIKAEDKLFDAIKKQIQSSLKSQINALNEQKKAIDSSLNSQIKIAEQRKDSIDKSFENQIKGLESQKDFIEKNTQAEIDSIDRVQKAKDKAREREEYLRNRSLILDDIASAKARSGIDARQAEKESILALEDLDRNYSISLEDAALEDRKEQIESNKEAQLESINLQIDALNKQKEAQIASIDEQIEKLNEQKEAESANIDEQIERLNKMFDEQSINMLAYSAMNSESLYNQYVTGFIEPMANGLLDGFLQANELMLANAITTSNKIKKAYETNFITPIKQQISAINENNLASNIGVPLVKDNPFKDKPFVIGGAGYFDPFDTTGRNMANSKNSTNSKQISNQITMNNTINTPLDYDVMARKTKEILNNNYYNSR